MTQLVSAITTPTTVRCAIYTRKSTEEGLDKAFTSLDAQREAALAYIHSQQHAGWTALPKRYDDGGYSGGTMDRPALSQLLHDIQAGEVGCVVVQKVDRFSRSLLDFAKMMEMLDRHQVAFVSVTQNFSTATSIGRLVLHILLSFAQFEREIIAERTRDKIAATRRKGKWCGGMPLLGYDVDLRTTKLVVNEQEAERVRAIFRLYRKHKAFRPVLQELARRGWVNKRWTTRKGRWRGGKPFTKITLRKLLSNCTYRGRVRYRHETHPGEHQALVDARLWQEVQNLFRRPGREPRASSNQGSLLQGLLRCRPCGCAMTPSQTRKGTRLYRYYTCCAAQKRGWHSCPSKAVPAEEIEQFVLEQIHERARQVDGDVFTAVPENLSSVEQAQMLARCVERIDYDGANGTMAITFQSGGSQAVDGDQTEAAQDTDS
jgi:site-specific DNA recombinase